MKKNNGKTIFIILIIVLGVLLLLSILFNVYLLFFNKGNDAEKKEYVGEYIWDDEGWYSILDINDNNTFELQNIKKDDIENANLYNGKYVVEGNAILVYVNEDGEDYYLGYYYIRDKDVLCSNQIKCDSDYRYVRGKADSAYKVFFKDNKVLYDDNDILLELDKNGNVYITYEELKLNKKNVINNVKSTLEVRVGQSDLCEGNKRLLFLLKDGSISSLNIDKLVCGKELDVTSKIGDLRNVESVRESSDKSSGSKLSKYSVYAQTDDDKEYDITNILLGESKEAELIKDDSKVDNESGYKTSSFNKIKAQDIASISDGKTVMIWIGRQTCGYCALYAPIVEKVQKEYGFTANYLDLYSIVDASTSTLADEDAYNTLMNLKGDNTCISKVTNNNGEKIGCGDVLNERFGATPLTFFVRDNKIVGALSGYVEAKELSSILEEIGFKK